MFLQGEMDLLIYWIRERESIRKKKDAGKPKPWTNDPILRDHRFCNVRRMDDKVSQWLLRNWYPSSYTLRPDQWLAAACLARLINWPDTLFALGTPFRRFDPFMFMRILEHRTKAGLKVFTGAYIINGAAGGPKYAQVLSHIQGLLTAISGFKPVMYPDSLEHVHSELVKHKGFGSFIAGQVVADLYYTPLMQDAKDAGTWAPIGPGSRRGMRRLLGKPAIGGMSQREFSPLLCELIKQVKRRVPAIYNDRQLTAMDIQNCLCEFDKYRRLQLNEGSVRNRYPGAK